MRKKWAPDPVAIIQKRISNALEDKKMDTSLAATLTRGLRLVNNGLESPCWIRGDDSESYTAIKFNGKGTQAHRVLFYLFKDKHLTHNGCHKCDKPACINPDHIFDGTGTANCMDAVNKNKAPDFGQLNRLHKEIKYNHDKIDLHEVDGVDRECPDNNDFVYEDQEREL